MEKIADGATLASVSAMAKLFCGRSRLRQDELRSNMNRLVFMNTDGNFSA